MPPQNACNFTDSGVEIEITHVDQDVAVNPVEVVQHNGSGEIVSYIDLNTDAAPYRFVQNNITQPVKELSASPQPKSALKIIKVGMAPSIGGAAQSRFVQQNTQQVPETSPLPLPKSTVRLLKGNVGAAQYTFVQQNTQPVQGTSALPPPERVTSFKGGAAQTLSIYRVRHINPDFF